MMTTNDDFGPKNSKLAIFATIFFGALLLIAIIAAVYSLVAHFQTAELGYLLTFVFSLFTAIAGAVPFFVALTKIQKKQKPLE